MQARGSPRRSYARGVPGRSLVPAVLAAAVAIGTVAAAPVPRRAAPVLRAPAGARVGAAVTVRASGLRNGRYVLTLVSDRHPARGVSCLARLSRASAAAGGVVRLRGTIPARIVCYQGLSTRLGAVPTTPGRYQLTVAVPIAPSGFDGGRSFVRAAIRISAAS